MVYFFFLLITIGYSYRMGKLTTHYRYTPSAKLVSYFPIIILAVIICGGQYYVGSDYPSYIRMFNGFDLQHYVDTGEILFVNTVKLLLFFGIKGNCIFAFLYLFCFVLFGAFIYRSRISSQYIFIFILLYVCFTGLFNNQLNIVRQALAIYVGSLGALEVINRKWILGIILILISALFHTAAIIYTVFIITPLIKNVPNWILYLMLIVGSISGIYLSMSFFDIFLPVLPPAYAWHIDGGAIEERTGITLITKYIFIPLFILSIKNNPKFQLSSFHKQLFIWGIIGFSLKIGLLGLTIVSRISDYWLLFSIFPLYFYLKYLWESSNNKQIYSILILSSIILFYFVKTCIYPSNEYAYQSIYQFYF